MPLPRRQFLAAASAAFVSTAVDPRSLLAQAPAQTPPQPAFTPVRRSVGIFTGQGGTIGWHADSKGAVVVDSQFPATAQICLDGIRQRTGDRAIDYLVNTHHHGDHTAGNGVFQPAVRRDPRPRERAETPEGGRRARGAGACGICRGTAAAAGVRQRDVRTGLARQGRRRDDGTPALRAGAHQRRRGGALREGECRARGGPRVQPPAPGHRQARGASIANWIKVLDQVAAAHGRDTIYIFGHAAAPKYPVTGNRADLAYMRDYLSALIEFVQAEMKAGKSRDEAS